MKAGGSVIEPVHRGEASLDRGPGGDPKSSLGGPRTAREVAGYSIRYSISQSRNALRASYSNRAWAFATRAGTPGRPPASDKRKAELPPCKPPPRR